MTRFLLRVLPVAVIAGVAIAPASVDAAAPLIFHGRIADSAEDVDLCGINVDVSTTETFTDKLFLDSAGNVVSFMSSVSVKSTFTADNGKSVVVQASNLFVDTEPVIDEAAGTITFSSSYKGLPEKISTARGPVLLRDAGLITFSDTYDLNTFELISSDVIINGPHPEADSDFVLFCEVITAALA